ncbi:VolA/Pla-1 family phospholipase [Moritella sp. Urea-trap-13]|uniref:VolA/Pla-1 family phospholipase n=1 Tax=Moritella sp. Urea-trap-13 TaxID=2058327 RepID=UPI0012FEBEBE|nr:VolA/Pla-1 family phospholipase [Moritella sp. Urea-trap-13]
MPRKKILASLIISSFALTACDSDTEVLDVKENKLYTSSRIQFSPADGIVSLPNDLLFSGTTDGTLELPDELAAIKVASAAGTTMTYADSTYAIGALDGWSTTHPIVIGVDLYEDRTLDVSSIEQPGAVRILKVSLGGPLSASDNANCKLQDSLTVCVLDGFGTELSYGTDFITTVNGNSIAVVPLKPFAAKASYMYLTTNLIKDSEGESVNGSVTYQLLKKDYAENPIGDPSNPADVSAVGLQKLVNHYDSFIPAFGIDASTVTHAGVFTTQSVFDVIDTVQSQITSAANATFTFTPVDKGYDTPTANVSIPSSGDVYSASATLPYYLSKTSSDSYWQAAGSSIAAVGVALGTPYDDTDIMPLSGAGLVGQIAACPIAGLNSMDAAAVGAIVAGIKTNPTAVAQLLPYCDIKYDTGAKAGDSIDPFKHLTRFNPLPAAGSLQAPVTQNIDIQITLPKSASAPYPVNISIHGLGTLKETTLATADAFAQAGIATIAIDMPLHGSRGLNVGTDGVYEISATDAAGAVLLQDSLLPIIAASYAKGSPLAFVNINSGLTVRDNFRQAIVDLLTLRAQLGNFIDPIGGSQLFDTDKVTVHGLSLGAITAASFTTYANRVSNTTFNVTKASLVAPTSGLAWAFAESPSFRPAVLDGLVAVVAEGKNVEKPTPGSSTYAEYLQIAIDTLEPSLKFAIQTLVDPIDPINMASTLVVNTPALHVIEVVGDGFDGDIYTLTEAGQPAYDINATNKSDQTLPNFGAIPVTGTERLIANLGLPCVTATTATRGAVRFKNGHHSSLISTKSAAGATTEQAAYATAEMQSQVVKFAASGTIVIDNSNDVINTTCPL